MRIEIEYKTQKESSPDMMKVDGTICGYFKKAYESQYMDEDIMNCTNGKIIDRIIISDAQLASKQSIESMITFLTKAKENFKY